MFICINVKQQVTNNTCDILDEAIKRYGRIISAQTNPQHRRHRLRASVRLDKNYDTNRVWMDDPLFDGFLDQVTVNLESPCETKPTWEMTEQCKYSTF